MATAPPYCLSIHVSGALFSAELQIRLALWSADQMATVG